MENEKQPRQAKTVTQTPDDVPMLRTLLWVMGGLILFATVITTLVIFGP
jgi:hypothetical protein